MSTWTLKRTAQCKKCPWRVDVDPHDIPNGYDEAKHRALERTIAKDGNLSALLGEADMHIMACHETTPGEETHCVGWLMNQVGRGNNIALRIQMLTCTNAGDIRLVGRQHKSFEETLP